MSKKKKSVGRRFWTFLKRYKRLVYLAIIGNIYTVGIAMLAPLFVKVTIDSAIPSRNVSLLVGLVVLYLFLELTRHTVGYSQAFLSNYAGQRTIFDIRKALFSHLQLLHLAFYERQKSASLVNRVIYDAVAIQQFINQAVTSLTNSLMSLVFAMVIMLFLNWQLTLLCLTTLPIYFFVVHHFRKKIHRRSHDVRERQAALAGMLGETFTGIRVVKSFAQEDHERKRFALTIKDNFYPELELPVMGQRMTRSLALIFSAVFGTVLLIGGSSVMNNTMTIGAFVAYTSYLTMLFTPMNNFSNLIQISTNARAGFERILQLLDTRPEVMENPDAIELTDIRGKVEFSHISFSYERGRAIEDLSLTVEPGESVALVGPSGSGKSTLVSLLTRFYEVESGAIRIDDIDLRNLKYDTYRQQLGIVLQENFLFSGTIEENIRYGRPEASLEEIREAAAQANALGFIEEMPEGFQTQVGPSGVMLSGGQRQRIAIARCILKNPRILIFDEATSALDNTSEAMIQQSMERLMQGKTTFIVAHRLSTIRKADRIVVMKDGRIAETGTHDELMARKGLYSHLHHPDAGKEAAA